MNPTPLITYAPNRCALQEALGSLGVTAAVAALHPEAGASAAGLRVGPQPASGVRPEAGASGPQPSEAGLRIGPQPKTGTQPKTPASGPRAEARESRAKLEIWLLLFQDHTPCTPHPTPYTLTPKPYTRTPPLQALNPNPALQDPASGAWVFRRPTCTGLLQDLPGVFWRLEAGGCRVYGGG